jgi:hypothetical protein
LGGYGSKTRSLRGYKLTLTAYQKDVGIQNAFGKTDNMDCDIIYFVIAYVTAVTTVVFFSISLLVFRPLQK